MNVDETRAHSNRRSSSVSPEKPQPPIRTIVQKKSKTGNRQAALGRRRNILSSGWAHGTVEGYQHKLA